MYEHGGTYERSGGAGGNSVQERVQCVPQGDRRERGEMATCTGKASETHCELHLTSLSRPKEYQEAVALTAPSLTSVGTTSSIPLEGESVCPTIKQPPSEVLGQRVSVNRRREYAPLEGLGHAVCEEPAAQTRSRSSLHAR